MRTTRLTTMVYMAMLLAGLFIIPAVPTIATALVGTTQRTTFDELDIDPDNFPNEVMNYVSQDTEPGISADYDIGLVLQDNPNHYKTIFEPWKTKAAIHAIAYDEATGFLALGGGYLYDNEVHIWRLNTETGMFDKVWDSGDGILRADVISLAWGDTDLNDFLEVAAASSDGFVYVFEQRHIYDPYANTENMFDHVWTSPYTFRAFDVKIYDADRDYREDIIVGSWDGKVRCFEYDNHSGYPFAEEHWITYRKVWDSGDTIEGRVYTLAYGDTNFNGLPEIVAGTREGRVYVFENDGVHLMINGEPFPLINDNHYKLVWTSENYTWRPIMSMEVGELDQTPGEEIALVAQGQGVFVLNWDELRSRYSYERIYRGWDAWQTDEESPWRLDFWADSIVSANNVTFQLANGTVINEPIVYDYIGAGLFDPPAQCYPYNTGLANATDFYYSIFNADVAPNATAVVDFGKDEEGTGSTSAEPDLVFRFQSLSISASKVNISVGQSPTDFEQVDISRISAFLNYLYVDVDDALGARKWDWFRYVRISVYGGVKYLLDSVKLMQVYTQITSALTVAIGPLPTTFNLFGPPNEPDRLIITTVIGNFYAYNHNETTFEYDLVWDSSRDDFFKLDTNVWDMVYVGHETRIPIWLIGGIQYQMPTTGTFRHWTIGDLYQFDWVGGMNPHEMIVVDSNNQFIVYKTSPNPIQTIFGQLEEDLAAESYFANIETAVGTDPATVEMVLFKPFEMPVAVVGTFDPTIEESDKYGLAVGAMNADIQFYHRAGPTDPFLTSGVQDSGDVDDTGDIVVALSNAKAVPRMKFVDWDGDGDLDMILSTGFLYYCENIGIPSGWNVPRFRMHKGYFGIINSGDSMNDYWGQPEVLDIDQDGDLDLIMSYDTRAGATCWLNKGTSDEPVWVQNKKLFSNTRPETNLKYNKFTNIRMVPYNWNLPQDFWKALNDEMVTLADGEYTMMAYKTDTNKMSIFYPAYDQSASYVLATYPTVYRYEFAIQNEGAYNFGYHATESWSTANDLANWTLTVRSDDVDNDGKGEIIVGDYDNNIYIFEHMVNNTYKRAFRSFDINHTEVSDTSPYMWEELEGISGTFNRVIWDHVTHLLAGCDLDSDGYKELIAAAGLQVYVFEDTGIDDTYDLVYTIDLLDSGFTASAGWTEDTVITALGAGDDYDLNDERELVVAAGAFLFVYNIGYDSWTRFNEYFMETKSLDGRYYMIGNGAEEDYREASIEALALCDTDEDGFREIILGGRVNTTQMREDGFLKIYEWHGATFEEVWDAPPTVTYWNPVTSIVLDDQDYDSKQEIIIGHTQGFDIWEYRSGDNTYRKVDVVTSSPNYPVVPLASTYVPGETHGLTSRGDNDLAYLWNINDNIIVSVFCHMNELWWRLYSVPAQLWSSSADLVTVNYPGYIGGAALEYEPSLFLHDNGSLYLTWKTYIYYLGDYYYDLWVSRLDLQTGQWLTPKLIASSSQYRDYPSLYSLGNSLGVVYTLTTNHRVYYRTLSDWSASWSVGYSLLYKNYGQYYIQSCDIMMLPDGGWALAVSGRNNTLSKTDLDIFVATCNSSFIWNNSSMYRATTSYNNEVNPDLGLLDAPEDTLMVAYESIESPIEDRIQMSYSNTYTIWKQHEPLATLPQSIIRVELPGGGVKYWYNETVEILALQALCPSLVGMRGGGFMQTHTFAFWAGVQTPLSPAYIIGSRGPYGRGQWKEGADLLYGINPSSRFTHFTIESVVDMAVGDTDGDGRREVVAGFDEFVGVYELKHSNVGNEVMQHEEAWLTNPLPEPVTGVTVYDSNGNGYEEIGISCERGEVFLFEVADTGSGKIPLLHSEELWSSTIGAATAGGTGAPQVLMYDVDNDGKDEIFRGELNGTIRAYDDDGSPLWSNSDYPEGVFWMDMGPMTPTGTEVFIVATRSPTTFSSWTNISLINAMTGATHWHNAVRNFVLTPLCIAAIGDVCESTDSEIIVTNTLNDVFVFAWNGTQIYNASTVFAWIGNNIVLGNFSGRANLDIGLVLTNGSLVVLSGNNGTVLFSIGAAMGTDIQRPTAADFNGDGFDEIFLARYNLWVVDSLNKSILYNSTNIFTEVVREVYVADYDNDTILEAILVTDHHVYLEEITSGRVVWSYEYLGDRIEDSQPAEFLDGRLGVALCSHDGAVMGLDGMTGVVTWFAQSADVYNELVAGDFDGDGLTELGGSDEATGDIYVYNEVEPWTPMPPAGYGPWTQYWNLTINPSRYFTIRGLWPYDVDSDGVTEMVIIDSDRILWLYSPVEPMPVWKVDFGANVYDVKFADFGGDATVDLLVLTLMGGKYRVLGLDGSDGNRLTGIDEEAPVGTMINVIAAADFTAAVPGMEYAIAYTTAANLTYIGFYDNLGNQKYASSFNATSFYPTHVVVSDLYGDAKKELLLAGISSGTDGDVFIWQGDGVYVGSLSAGYPLIVDVQPGNFDGDALGDLAVAFESGEVWTWELYSTPFWQVNMNATVSSLVVANMDGSPTDEVVANTDEEGIIVCDGPAFGEKWRYNALTTVSKKVAVRDINGDGVKDIVIMLEDHIGVITYGTGDVVGAYTMTHSPRFIYVGNFDNAAPLDLMYYYAGKVYCITDHTTPPLPIPSPGPLFAGISLLETTVVSAIVGLPIAGIVVSIPMFVRRRRKH